MIKLFFEIAHIIMIVARCTTTNRKRDSRARWGGGRGFDMFWVEKKKTELKMQ